MLNINQVKKDFRFAFTEIPHATHQPVLFTICNKPNLKILEFGCGVFSTGLLSYLNLKLNHNIITFENDQSWIDEIIKNTPYKILDNHQIYFVENWNIFFETDPLNLYNNHYDVIFIDQAPWEARELTLDRLKNNADYIIIHDSDFMPEYDINYDKYLKYYKIFMPLQPYPYKSGPPTLLGSNIYDCNIDINYGDFV